VRGGRVVVIGIGELARRDDAAGRWVARRLRGALPRGIELRESSGEATDLLELWEGAARAYVIDATRSARPPGTVVRRSGGTLPAPPATTSTHGLGLAEAIALGRALGRAPEELVVYGIEAGELGSGEGLSPPVAAAVEAVAERLRIELGGAPGGADGTPGEAPDA
jgi:hydrogenase maturation protease